MAVAFGVAFGAALSTAGPAAADPSPPGDPAARVDSGPPVPQVESLGPLGALAGLGGADLLLSQYAVPSAPGGAQPAAPPPMSVLDASQFLNPLNYRVTTPDQLADNGSPYQLAPGQPGPFARVDSLKGQHAIVHGALGRMPIGELCEPLAGTAPPPGTAIPAGPLQNLPDPAPIADPVVLPPAG